ncbi:MAG: hydrogenase formation protein HypD [Tepidanaerobacteraceae bacterium]|jgi:hydrogenase expression/formation protein HypD|nr:hydrogenase formation protein HypD [Tepidanaerobacteraceae bacterium]
MLKPRISEATVLDSLKKMDIGKTVRIMEVCGTHTRAIAKSGIKQLLPPCIELISGPGCPVCVTHQQDIEKVLQLALEPRVTIATFGDMMKVPGSTGSLREIRAGGADIRVVYSPIDAVSIARQNPDREVVFLAVGFETTAPAVAAAVLQAVQSNAKNFSILCMLKLIIPAMAALLNDPEIKADGFLCPGHVSAIIGTEPYSFIPEKYGKGCVVSGFEPEDILESIHLLAKQIKKEEYKVENQYTRGVRKEGNRTALALMEKFFEPHSVLWRGLGPIEKSGLKLKPHFAKYDAKEKFGISEVEAKPSRAECICDQILKGKKRPDQCPLFGRSCDPDSPQGPCMVSSEGTCAAEFYNA